MVAHHAVAAAQRRPRVMIVDDSVVVRGLVSRWVEADGAFELTETARTGRHALDILARAAPDIILLDLDMPELDGVATLPLLLQARPDLSVLVVSTLTQRNAEISLRCLKLGALEVLPKPSGGRELTTPGSFRDELMAKLHGLSARHRPPARLAGPQTPATPAPSSRAISPGSSIARTRAILIGASTGGPKAVATMLRGLRGDVAQTLPILIVQHMPPIFTRVFAQQLAVETGLHVTEARDGDPVLPGRVLVAPGGRHMGLAFRDGAISTRLDETDPIRHCRPAIDVLFRDAARLLGSGTLAIVLTGMGVDGTDGARAVVAAGGSVLVQDEATSVVWGMPGSIARAGLAREVLPLDELATGVGNLIGVSGRSGRDARQACGPDGRARST